MVTEDFGVFAKAFSQPFLQERFRQGICVCVLSEGFPDDLISFYRRQMFGLPVQ
jgi:hypothetical protein